MPFEKIDASMKTHSSTQTPFMMTEDIPMDDGSIVSFYNEKNELIHTSRYVKKLDWYKYCKEEHEEWYPKNRNLIKFNENNDLVIENFTSKLGEGFLIVHELNDIEIIYGSNRCSHKLV